MRIVIVSICISILSFALISDASQDLNLRYTETPSAIVSYAHYLENEMDVDVISDGEVGGSAERVKKEERTRSLDLRKDFELKSLNGGGTRPFYIMNERVSVLREDGTAPANAGARPHRQAMKMDSFGNPQAPTSLADFPYASFPFILPEHAVHEGDRWVSPLLVITDDGSEIDIEITYSFSRLVERDGMRIADIEYRLAGELTSTDITDDLGKLTRIEEMRGKGIEKITLSGTGRVGFDVDRHLPTIHVTDLILETSAKSIMPSQMVEKERTVEMHKAEAMIAL